MTTPAAIDQIPFLNFRHMHEPLFDEFRAVFDQCLQTNRFIGGLMVEGFEQDFAAYCEAKHCIAVGSGTDALRFAYIAGGINPGDIVVTVPNTFIATTEAISQAGATPAFVDIDERTYNMNPAALEAFLEKECKQSQATGEIIHQKTGKPVTAIVPVHLYGQPADMDSLNAIAAKYNLKVFEDACQAHGAKFHSQKDKAWRAAGSMSLAAAFSFYPGKNLGALGEGGAITTNDDQLAATCRKLRDHGQAQKYYHDIEGFNGRLDSLQCGLLQIKLRHLPAWTRQRQEAARQYTELLADIPVVQTPHEPEWTNAVYHLYVIRVKSREQLQQKLAEAGVSTGLHYPVPLHLQKAYEPLGYKKGDFPISEQAAEEILSLPMFPGITSDQISRVVNAIMKA